MLSFSPRTFFSLKMSLTEPGSKKAQHKCHLFKTHIILFSELQLLLCPRIIVNANVSGINHFVTMAFQAALCLINDSLSSFIRWSSGRNEFTPTAESDIKVNPQAEKRDEKNPLLSQIYLRIWPTKHPRAVAVIKNVTCHWGGWGVVKICGFLLLVSSFIEQNYWWNVVRSVSKGFLCNGRLWGMCLLQYPEWPLGK